MFSYSNSAFMDAEVRYRQEATARDWSPRHGSHGVHGSPTRRGRLAAALAGLRVAPRHHRHA
jgi:hypothetical protein